MAEKTHSHPIVHTHDGGKVHRHHATHTHEEGEVHVHPHAHPGDSAPAPGEIHGQQHTHDAVPDDQVASLLNSMYPTMGQGGPGAPGGAGPQG